MILKSVDLKTGKRTEREWTAEEIAAHEEAIARDAPTEKQLALQELQETDSTMPRPLEDLYDLLIDNGTITQIPTHAAEIITKRKNARAKLKGE